ncbi:MAG: hypothetical protein PVH87_27660, partial [Desulfobacteraceae bacterium]
MKVIIKFIKITGIVFAAAAVMAVALIYFSGPELPDNIHDTINFVMKSKLPEFLQGDTGYVQSGDTKIWFESIGPTIFEK